MFFTCNRSENYWSREERNKGRDPFIRAEAVRKFLGVEWIATCPDGLVPFHSQNELRAHLNGGCWITVARTRAR